MENPEFRREALPRGEPPEARRNLLEELLAVDTADEGHRVVQKCARTGPPPDEPIQGVKATSP